MPLDSGTRLGPYEVLAPIGEQADERYKASDTRSSRLVALKVLPAEFSSHPELRARLGRRAMSRVQRHALPGIVTLHEELLAKL